MATDFSLLLLHTAAQIVHITCKTKTNKIRPTSCLKRKWQKCMNNDKNKQGGYKNSYSSATKLWYFFALLVLLVFILDEHFLNFSLD